MNLPAVGFRYHCHPSQMLKAAAAGPCRACLQYRVGRTTNGGCRFGSGYRLNGSSRGWDSGAACAARALFDTECRDGVLARGRADVQDAFEINAHSRRRRFDAGSTVCGVWCPIVGRCVAVGRWLVN